MEPTTRWETAALRSGGGRPRPGAVQARTPGSGRADDGAADVPVGSRSESGEGPVAGETPGSPETLLVPLSAWNRMLEQLGNLHDAGRELAEARERAARAETEAAFLRERLAELRSAGDDTATVDAGGGRDDDGGDGGGVVAVGRRAASIAAGWLRRRGG